MIKDLINSDLTDHPKWGLTIHIVKKYVALTDENESFKINNFTIILIKSGEFKMHLKGENIHHLVPNDIIVLPKDAFCMLFEVRHKLQFFLMSFSSDFVFQNSIRRDKMDPFYFFIAKTTMKISLEDKDFLVLSLIYKLIYYVHKETDHSLLKNELKGNSFNLFLSELKIIYTKYQKDDVIHFNRNEKLVVQFLTLLAIHCKKQRKAKFYADLLFVSSGHLTKIVKQVAEKKVKELIVDAVIAEAKVLLGNSELSICAIADELEFSAPTFFTSFFKKHTSISPSEYRLNTIRKFKKS